MWDGGLSAVACWVADSCWGSRIKLFAPGLAGEAARSSPRKLFERCHGLAILYFGGWVGSTAVADEAIHFSPLLQVVKWHQSCFTIWDGWGSPRRRTKPPIGIRILYLGGDKADRGWLSAVADDVDFRGS